MIVGLISGGGCNEESQYQAGILLPRFSRFELSDRQGAESVLTARMLSVKDRTEPRGLLGE